MSRCDKTELCIIWFCFFCENSRTFSKVVTLNYAVNQHSIETPFDHILKILCCYFYPWWQLIVTGERWNRAVILIFNSIASNTFIWFLGNDEPRNHQTTDSWFSPKILDKVLLLRIRYTLTEGYWKTFLISVWKLSQMTSFQLAGRCQACCCG